MSNGKYKALWDEMINKHKNNHPQYTDKTCLNIFRFDESGRIATMESTRVVNGVVVKEVIECSPQVN